MADQLRDSTSIPFAEFLESTQMKQLQDNSNIVQYAPKDIIFRQETRNSHIMYVNKGLVKIYKQERNERYHIIKLAKPGEFIGLLTIFGSDIYQYSGAAIQATDICLIDKSAFYSVIQNNGTYALQLLAVESKDSLFIMDKLINQIYKQLPGRIASILLYFAEHIYKDHTFQLPLTRRELAELSGTTKESFIRTLTEFKNDRIIQVEGSRITINSMEIVRTLSRLG